MKRHQSKSLRRKTALLLVCLLLLSGCGRDAAEDSPPPSIEPSPSQTQPADTPPPAESTPAPSPALTRDYLQAAQVEVDPGHSFWVELTETPEDSPLDYDLLGGDGGDTFAVRVNIYRKQTDERPVQSFLDGCSRRRDDMDLCNHDYMQMYADDYNFDGYRDFSFLNMHFGYRCHGYAHYIWDPQAEQFVQDPYGLNRLMDRDVHEEERVITSYSSAAGGSESYWHHRYVDGELTVTRKCELRNEIGVSGFYMEVEELSDGAWEQVYWSDNRNERYGGVYDFWRNNFDYHGEGLELLTRQPIDDTHDFFTVPTGGRLGTVVVTVELGEKSDPDVFGPSPLTLSIWNPDDLTAPIQVIQSETDGVFHHSRVVDANFDGHMDFGYMYAMGNQPCYSHYWIWSEEQGQFVAEPEFDQISCPVFDPETGIIDGYARGGAAGLAGTHTLHRWIDGVLTCVRRVQTYPEGGAHVVLTVEEPADGTLTEVFRKTGEIADDGEIFDEVLKWLDPDYHGEE